MLKTQIQTQSQPIRILKYIFFDKINQHTRSLEHQLEARVITDIRLFSVAFGKFVSNYYN